MRRTKIIATVGPAIFSKEQINDLWQAGVDVFRFNFSHGSREDKEEWLRLVHSLPYSPGREPSILADLQGPKMRIGRLAGGRVFLEEGQRIVLSTEDMPGFGDRIPIDYAPLPEEVGAGDRILLDDGRLELKVIDSVPGEVRCLIMTGGILEERRGINLPGVNLSVSGLTEKDHRDLDFCLSKRVDFIALSFVRKAQDIIDVKEIIAERQTYCQVIAKIERPEAVTGFDDIMDEADGIMIARGDLGVEMGPEKVPLIQKEIIRKCNIAGKPVITATQMLESMISSPNPTRAETSDAANAILDGTDAVMLSGETDIGKFPIKAVQVLARVAVNIEEMHDYTQRFLDRHVLVAGIGLSEAIGRTACQLAGIVEASAIIAFTRTGRTAALVAKFRPSVPVWAVTPAKEVQRRLGLITGVYSLLVTLEGDMEKQIQSVEEVVLKTGILSIGDTVVIAMGCPISITGRTNLIKVHRLGKEDYDQME